MNWKLPLALVAVLALGGAGAYYLLEKGPAHAAAGHDDHGHAHGSHGHGAHAAEETAKGPHGGRLLRNGAFTLELVIFEKGVPPEFRAWFTLDGKPLAPSAVQLTVTLTRPGGVVNEHHFAPEGDYARSPDEVFEPHSFSYKILARHGDRLHRWEFDASDLQTTIAAAATQRAGVTVEAAGPAMMTETLAIYGRVKLDANRVARVTPRFAGLVREARKSVGDSVSAGEVVAIIEANQSLAPFEVKAPIAGVVIERTITTGEAAAEGAALYTLADYSSVWIDLQLPPRDAARVRVGQAVTLQPNDGGPAVTGRVAWLAPFADPETQTLTARVIQPNSEGRWRPGLFVQAEITLAEFTVPVAVKDAGLQTFFDFTVVFSQHGEIYQARPLTLGRRSSGFAEVLKGLAAGERYVVENSFLIKADIGKSGASHDH